jgi:hypothetical protein
MGKYKDQIDALINEAKRDGKIPDATLDDIRNKALYSIEEKNIERSYQLFGAIAGGIPSAIVTGVVAGFVFPPLFGLTIPISIGVFQALRSRNTERVKEEIVKVVKMQIDDLKSVKSQAVGRIGTAHFRIADVLPPAPRRDGGGGPAEEEEELLSRREKVGFPPKKFGEK